MRNLLFLPALFLLPLFTHSLQLDIHLPLYDPHTIPQTDLYQSALNSNNALHSISNGTEQIDFKNFVHVPHITLFLSDFTINLETKEGEESLEELFQVLEDTISSSPCINMPLVAITNSCPHLSGPYAMWNVPSTTCLTQISTSILYAVQPYVNHSQPIPAWIQNLPEPTRSKKLGYMKEYGSPNVLDEFEPHVTVGYDEDTEVDRRRKVLETLGGREGVLKWIAVGKAEEMGTVLPGPLWEMELGKESHLEGV